MPFDPHFHPYPSPRPPVYADRGMVATGHPLAAQAGLRILQAGGNAIDAAVATAAALTVVEPTANGIGGDVFALVWTGGKLHGLNGSGPSPALLTPEAVAGLEKMPTYGWLPVTVPGAPASWAALVKRFGRLPLTQVLAPAIELAERGHPIAPMVAWGFERANRIFRERLKGAEFQHWFDLFIQDGKVPKAGDRWVSKPHADTLRQIAETDADSFYRGALAQQIDQFSRETGGLLRAEDLAAFQPEWVEPIKVDYRGYQVWEIPPNGQGIVTLMALQMLEGFDFPAREDVQAYHRAIEAIKIAFADAHAQVTDPNHMAYTSAELLNPAYVAQRRELIGAQAIDPQAGEPPKGGTIYLATADDEGNMVSFIQSNYMGFGSGLVVPGTGITLQNRGHGFTLAEGHPNQVAPRKRPFHTIIPGFLTKGAEPIGPFGVMGGFMQPQGHLQVVQSLVDFGLNPQAALDAPRWQWLEGKKVSFESSVPRHIVEALARLGHQVEWATSSTSFGRGQIIYRLPNGTLVGGTEHRTDGQIAAW
ncbi:MAG TPA: gamma-glutamyltransferase family protein [Symbiobacteriaceae bacterium]|nr:gamma-glutamyltransferase family protein [Symbiobacteriaceae bacterium]